KNAPQRGTAEPADITERSLLVQQYFGKGRSFHGPLDYGTSLRRAANNPPRADRSASRIVVCCPSIPASILLTRRGQDGWLTATDRHGAAKHVKGEWKICWPFRRRLTRKPG